MLAVHLQFMPQFNVQFEVSDPLTGKMFLLQSSNP